MSMEALNLKVVIILTIGFAYASILGYIAQRVKLSPIVGYLVAGFLIGPFSPGYVANLETSEELAEIGVILMMFGTGLHLKWNDLISVKYIATTGAIAQTLGTSLLATLVLYYLGWPLNEGMIIGLSISVASTLVLVRVLADHHMLKTQDGHIKIGWVIVEDIITVVILLLLPLFATWLKDGMIDGQEVADTLGWMLLKFAILIVSILTFIPKIISYIIEKVQKTRSHELFILTILALTFLLASGSTMLFGTSIALGAFLAGLIIGQTNAHRRVDNDITPLRDIFVVIFFISVGMLFNPSIIIENLALFLIVLAFVLIIKPLIAIVTTLVLKYPLTTAISVGLGLAQIGEFSFILAQQAMSLHILSEKAFDIIVACSIISIAINPIVFRYFKEKTGK